MDGEGKRVPEAVVKQAVSRELLTWSTQLLAQAARQQRLPLPSLAL
jgi:hypothetical protein